MPFKLVFRLLCTLTAGRRLRAIALQAWMTRPGGDAIAKETGLDYFSVPVELGPKGAEKAHNPIGSANEYEQKLLKACYEGLKGNIAKGVDFVANPPAK